MSEKQWFIVCMTIILCGTLIAICGIEYQYSYHAKLLASGYTVQYQPGSVTNGYDKIVPIKDLKSEKE